MAITPLPPAPEPSDTPQQFNTKAFAFVDALADFVTEANAQASQVDSDATSASSSASTATTKAAEAAASAASAAAAVNVTQWSSAASYSVGANVFSPIDFQTYRNKTGSNTATDPSLDNTNWERISFSANPTFGTATATTAIVSDTISERTSAAGVTVDSLLIKDGTALVLESRGLFSKASPTTTAWSKTGNFTVSTAQQFYVEVGGKVLNIASATVVTMPGSATAGTDYAIWCKTDGSLEATTDHTTPPATGARKLGGFHYAPGGNASGVSGGNTTAQINEYSFWDLKFKPACHDPRGMTLVANSFWADIYLCGVDHHTNGTSKNNVTIADGSAPPKIPTAFGGNNSNAYANGTWYVFNEVMQSHGKKLPTYTEFCALAYGATEEQSRGNDPITTGIGTTNNGTTNTDEEQTSKWGVIQATGVLWVWCRDFIASGKDASDGGWQDITGDRGNVYTFGTSARAGFLGGAWDNGSNAGSRCSVWSLAPSFSIINVGGRGVCDHLQLD